VTRISVITPTWHRADLLTTRCIPSVFGQTWPDIEHVVVSDGPDRALALVLAGDTWRRPRKTRPLVFDQLPEHLNGTVDYGARARNRGAQIATGDYIAYLDDDNAYRPQHLQVLADALDAHPDAEFAYSQMLTHPHGNIIGAPIPTYGGIDTSLIMHRPDTLAKFGQWLLPDDIEGDKHAPDWAVVAQWLDKGASWIHVPQVTVDYYFAGS